MRDSGDVEDFMMATMGTLLGVLVSGISVDADRPFCAFMRLLGVEREVSCVWFLSNELWSSWSSS